MATPNAIFDTVAAPVYAGLAIALLLSARELESWRHGSKRNEKAHAFRENGPVRAGAARQR